MSNQSTDPRRFMRWATLMIFLIMIPISFITGIILAYQTKDPLPLAMPTPLLFAMRPIIRYLFR